MIGDVRWNRLVYIMGRLTQSIPPSIFSTITISPILMCSFDLIDHILRSRLPLPSFSGRRSSSAMIVSPYNLVRIPFACCPSFDWNRLLCSLVVNALMIIRLAITNSVSNSSIDIEEKNNDTTPQRKATTEIPKKYTLLYKNSKNRNIIVTRNQIIIDENTIAKFFFL